MVEITDQISAKIWLSRQPRAAQVAVTVRSAFRQFTFVAEARGKYFGAICEAVCRALLSSGVAVLLPTSKVMNVARYAGNGASAEISEATGTSAMMAVLGAGSGAYTASATEYHNRIGSVEGAFIWGPPLGPDFSGSKQFWEEATKDAERIESGLAATDLFNFKLWGEVSPQRLRRPLGNFLWSGTKLRRHGASGEGGMTAC